MSIIAVDIETINLEVESPITSVAVFGGHEYFVDFWSDQTAEKLQAYLDEHTPVFHHAAFDIVRLRRHGIRVGEYHDTQAMRYCLLPGEQSSLEVCAWEYLGKRKDAKPNFEIVNEDTLTYNMTDARLTYNLYRKLMTLMKQVGVYEFYTDVELPYINRIIEMEDAGCKIDLEQLYIQRDLYKQVASEAELELYDAVSKLYYDKPMGSSTVRIPKPAERTSAKEKNAWGIPATVEFNPNSPEHIVWVLQQSGVKLTKTTKSGKLSADASVIEKEADKGNEICTTLLKYRKADKILSTFIPGIEKGLDSKGRVHTSFRQFDVKTGRLSSSAPNLQNIPGRDERGAMMRSMFICNDGSTNPQDETILLVGDLDRIELVVLGFYLELYLGYSTLSDRIKSGEDVHESNRKEWSYISGIELTRKFCKNGIFGRVYGCGVNKFAATIKVPVEAAKAIFAESELMQAVEELRELFIREAIANDGYFTNFLGRNLYIPNILESGATRARGERQVFNYAIQSTAGDAFKILQNNVAGVSDPGCHQGSDWFLDNRQGSETFLEFCGLRQLLVVHDEAIYEMPRYHRGFDQFSIVNDVAAELSKFYTTERLLYDSEFEISATVRCEFHAGSNWFSAKGE